MEGTFLFFSNTYPCFFERCTLLLGNCPLMDSRSCGVNRDVALPRHAGDSWGGHRQRQPVPDRLVLREAVERGGMYMGNWRVRVLLGPLPCKGSMMGRLLFCPLPITPSHPKRIPSWN